MDWKSEIGTNLWVFPRGVKRTGESEYPANTGDRPAMSLALWAQYVLDNFATVAGAVAALTAAPLRVVTAQVPGEDRLSTVHLALSDAGGDSAIVVYIGGEQVIHHGREYQVMTNSPVFSKQLAITEYWEEIGGTVMLPGTNRAADRFVRASFYINAVPKTADPLVAVAAVFRVVRNASTPYGIATSDSATSPPRAGARSSTTPRSATSSNRCCRPTHSGWSWPTSTSARAHRRNG